MCHPSQDNIMLLILLIILVLGVTATMPAWPHSRSWGYYPSGLLTLLALILLIFMFSGRL